MMNVKVAKVPGRIVEVALEDGATVSEALEAAGVDSTGFTIQVNGAAADGDTALSDNTTVLLTQRIKGNTELTVKVAKVPGRVIEVVVPAGSTVRDAIAAADVATDGFSVQMSGADASLDTPVRANATVMLTQRIKGNEG